MAKKPAAPPPAPDYSALATQQADLDRQAAQQQTRTNRPNQVNPWGEVRWNEGKNGQWTQTTSLNAQDQALLDQSRTARGGLMGRASQTAMSEFNPDLANFATVDPSKGEFGYVKEVQDAMMGALRPGLDRARERDQTRLSAMGNVGNTRLSQRTNEDISIRENDAERKALLSAVDVSGNLVDRQSGLATQQNQTRAQQLSEALRRRSLPMQEYAQFQDIEQGMQPQFENFNQGTPFESAQVYQAGQDQDAATMARYNAQQAARSNRRGGLIRAGTTLLGAGGGFLAGGPAGAFKGAQIGSQIGSRMG
jgi:hypothetical protein